MPIKETAVRNSILAYIRCIGRAARVQSGKIRTDKSFINMADKGTPDILSCINGKFVGIEVKRDQQEVEERFKQKDTRSQGQKRQGAMISKAGGYYYVVASAAQLRDNLIADNIVQ